MDDTSLLLTLAFGGDGGRVLWLPALASLFVTLRWRPSRVAVLAFALDRMIPYAGLWSAHGREAVLTSLAYQVSALPADALWLGLRFLGFYAVIAFLWRLRLAVHGRRPVTQAPARA